MLIGDVARRSGVSARMLRHYESLGLLRPTGRSAGGYREYSGDDIRRISHIEMLRSLGLSLREVGRALDDPEFTPSALVADLIRQTRERIAAETELLTRLRRIDTAEPAGWDDVLRVVALLQALGSDSAGRRQRAALAPAQYPALFPAERMPVEALVEAALSETDPNAAGALRWALARSGEEGLGSLAEALDAPSEEVRRRAVDAIAEIPGEAATAILLDYLTETDPGATVSAGTSANASAGAFSRGGADVDLAVRRRVALVLGARGVAEAVPTLIGMIVDQANDVDAADALSVLAADPALTDRIATGLVDRLHADDVDAAARGRLTQALADIPGEITTRALTGLTGDEDRAVALTATYLLKRRAG
ncbi:MerR family transcriptional regulator [Actinoplanes missouriensis]|uniref:MerR family transcriptional regulator n=1 Tax=Actinoplanes missouriensis TaxID=1866 RepID=UPI0033FAEB7E